MHDEPILQTFGLSKRYKKRWAVRDLNLTVRRGEVFGFLGPNGAGKSTTIRMLLTLVKPTAGRIEFFGKPLSRNRASALKRVGGLVEAADFYLYLSARRNLEIVASLRKDGSSGDINRVLDIVGLLDRAKDKVKTYSHGMKQRLGIAQALLGSPEMVVLDEPTSGLDPQGIKEVRELIQRLSQSGSITVFLSSHLLSEIEQTATSMAIINQGSLIVQGKVAELLAAGPAVIRFDARPRDRALEILRASPLVGSAALVDQYVECSAPHEATATLVRALVESGLSVHAAIPRRSLEEYFLSITEGASDVRVPDLSAASSMTGGRRR
jgi:ABC-type multidrug transport system ATPase subunit